MPVRRIILVLGLVGTIIFTLYTFNLPRKHIKVRTTSYSPGTTNVTLAINPELDSSLAAKFYIQEIRIEADGIIIRLVDDLPPEIYSLPIYLNENFRNNQLYIPRNAHFETYVFSAPPNLGQNKIHSKNPRAFIVALPIGRRNDNQSVKYRFLYLSEIRDNIAIFKYEEGFKSEKNIGMSWGNFGSFRVAVAWKKN